MQQAAGATAGHQPCSKPGLGAGLHTAPSTNCPSSQDACIGGLLSLRQQVQWGQNGRLLLHECFQHLA